MARSNPTLTRRIVCATSALMLHVAALVVLQRIAPAPRIDRGTQSVSAIDVELMLVPAAVSASAPAGTAVHQSVPTARRAAGVDRRPPAAMEVPSPPVSAFPNEPPALDEYGDSAAPPPIAGAPSFNGGGSNASPIFGPLPAPPAPSRPEVRPGPTGDIAGEILAATMHAQDAETGFVESWAGSAASVVVDAVRSADPPDGARATLTARFDERGDLASVDVDASFGADAAIWSDVAREAGRRLARCATPPAYRRSSRVIVTVQSLHLYAAGGRKRALPATVSALPPRVVFDLADIGATRQPLVRWSFSIVRPGERRLPSGAVTQRDGRAPWLPPRHPGNRCMSNGSECRTMAVPGRIRAFDANATDEE